MNGKKLITLKNVGVRFKFRQSLFNREYFDALKDVSCNIYRGDSLGVIGRNGAGKTTLLRLIGGIIKPDRGRVINNDVSTTLLAMQIGFDPELTGRANALVSGMLLGFSKKEVLANMDKVIDFAELNDFIDRPTRTYSAGMKARLGFSIALEMSPDVLLIDEVLGVGDANFQKKSMAVMKKKLLSDQTIVFVSHSAPMVKSLCNKAIWVEEGITVMEGDSDEVVAAYEQSLKN
jgi:homopolymeric O-antigen transport system ATP-binding protein